ncbi:hypothetical protein A2U01_0061992 [Trifolium medium]|uniref:Uncharacterized protein n=1 Tax=Trifolium medium TaxID=97028 RepID=A0A392RWK6_9FABA|nr:hypothetical protein [Trifolium medium]
MGKDGVAGELGVSNFDDGVGSKGGFGGGYFGKDEDEEGKRLAKDLDSINLAKPMASEIVRGW